MSLVVNNRWLAINHPIDHAHLCLTITLLQSMQRAWQLLEVPMNVNNSREIRAQAHLEFLPETVYHLMLVPDLVTA